MGWLGKIGDDMGCKRIGGGRRKDKMGWERIGWEGKRRDGRGGEEKRGDGI